MLMDEEPMPSDEPPPDPAFPPTRRGRKYSEDPVSLGLRKLWQSIENEPIPPEFLDLLDAIDTARATPKESDADQGKDQ